MRKTGRYETLGSITYFIPHSLPPQNPPLALDSQATTLYGEAMLELGKLDEMSKRLPDINRFIKAYIIKEALLSSSIEGIHTTLLDVFTQPLLASKPCKETELVINYVTAVNIAVSMIQKRKLPITVRVMLSAHRALMGDGSDPGRYRKQAVRVGNLVAPPPLQIPELMAELEHYINSDDMLPPLIKAGLAHVQFETIHPFLDGNGRIGRLLIVLILLQRKLLSTPVLYLSYYFKKHHLEYYQRLDNVRTQGDFEGWIVFYLTAIRDSSSDAYRRAQEIEALEKKLVELILNHKCFNKMKDTALNALSILFSWPVISVKELSLQLDRSYNTAHRVISNFIELGLLTEETQQKRGRLFMFKVYLEILEKNYSQ